MSAVQLEHRSRVEAVRIAANIKESDVPAAGRTAGEAKIIEKMATDIYAKRGAEALKTAATRFIHGTHVDGGLDRILTGIDPSTGKPNELAGSGQAAERTKAKDSIALSREYLLHGYDRLPAAEQVKLRDIVRAHLLANPLYKDAFIDSLGNIPQATIEGILRDKKLRNKLADNLNTLFDPTTDDSPELRQQILKARTDAARLGGEITVLIGQERAAATREDTAKDNKTAFDTDATYTSSALGTTATKESVYQTLARKPEVTKYLRDNPILERLKAKVAAVALGGPSLTTAEQTQMTALTTSVAALEAMPTVDEYKTLSVERLTINEEFTTATQELGDIRGKLDTKRAERAVHNNTEHQAMLRLQTASVDMQNGAQFAIENALTDHFDGDTASIITEYPTYKADSDSIQEAEGRRIFDAYIARRWQTYFKGKVILDRDLIKADMNMLLRDGFDALLNKILDRAGITTAAQPAIRDALDKSTAFKDAQRKSLIAKIFALNKEVGLKLTKDEEAIITHADWAQDAITEFVTKSENAANLRQILQQQGINVQEGKFNINQLNLPGILKVGGGITLLILAALLGGPLSGLAGLFPFMTKTGSGGP